MVGSTVGPYQVLAKIGKAEWAKYPDAQSERSFRPVGAIAAGNLLGGLR
jgi:hypothetical protein